MQHGPHHHHDVMEPPGWLGSVWAGAAGGAAQLVILALVMGSAIPAMVTVGLAALGLACLQRTKPLSPPAGVRHAVSTAGWGGLAMLVGPGLDWVRAAPLGTHAGWSLAAMVVVCWCVCDAATGSVRSARWAYACRAGSLLGMALGMTMAHVLMAGHTAHASHGSAQGASFVLAHATMVVAMTAGSSLATTGMTAAKQWFAPTPPSIDPIP